MDKIEPTLEKSQQQAEIIEVVKAQMLMLDLPYLKEFVKRMKENLSFKESALILSSSPITQQAKNDYQRTIIRFTELIIAAIELRKGPMMEAFLKMQESQQSATTLENLFK